MGVLAPAQSLSCVGVAVALGGTANGKPTRRCATDERVLVARSLSSYDFHGLILPQELTWVNKGLVSLGSSL